MEEGDSKDDLTHERFDRPWFHIWDLEQHVPEMRTKNREHQHVMFPIHSTNSKLVQGGEDVFRSWVCPTRLGRKVTIDFDFVVPTGKFCNNEFEGDVSTILGKGFVSGRNSV